MNIKANKTEDMIVSKTEHKIDVRINNNKVQQIKNFKYLGSVIIAHGDLEPDINSR